MNEQNMKCVMVIDEHLPLGIITNTAAVLGITLGKKLPHIVGVDVFDKEDKKHLGITNIPIPILKGNATLIKEIREQLYQSDFSELTVVDFTNAAQSCNCYDDFSEKISTMSNAELTYYGIAIYGNKKLVNKLTGSMPLLR